MKEYIEVEYDITKRPLTDYPSKLANYIYDKHDLKSGLRLLDIGCGRGELAFQFKKLGLKVTGLDSSASLKNLFIQEECNFIMHSVESGKKIPAEDNSFDCIFIKSFIEHVNDPRDLILDCNRLLRNDGKIIILTPDWEANVKIFFDDITHVKPFTRISMSQLLELTGFEKIEVYKFRQLPITWSNSFVKMLSIMISPLIPHRNKIKFFRWSKELMLVGIGNKIDTSSKAL
jgi:2-polyprenyl-3-methyl-5-hydroxy-6-metoxy-1,4-benzoquinol methylase